MDAWIDGPDSIAQSCFKAENLVSFIAADGSARIKPLWSCSWGQLTLLRLFSSSILNNVNANQVEEDRNIMWAAYQFWAIHTGFSPSLSLSLSCSSSTRAQGRKQAFSMFWSTKKKRNCVSGSCFRLAPAISLSFSDCGQEMGSPSAGCCEVALVFVRKTWLQPNLLCYEEDRRSEEPQHRWASRSKQAELSVMVTCLPDSIFDL